MRVFLIGGGLRVCRFDPMMSLVILNASHYSAPKRPPCFLGRIYFPKVSLHFRSSWKTAVQPRIVSLILTQWGSLRSGKSLVWNLARPFTNDDFRLGNTKRVITREIFRVRAFKEIELEAHCGLISMRWKDRNIGEEQGVSTSKQSIF